jgi:penicillin amidase
MSLLDKLTLLILKPIVKRRSLKALPQIEGDIALSGLKAPVKVLRDAWGVPHIYAESLGDLAFAQGYVHAQDRLWQMELNRRVARGKVSELVGPDGLDTDRATRTLGFDRLARADYDVLTEELRGHLQDYVNGVNAYLEANRKKLPVEFSLLKCDPVPWEVVDVMALSRMLAWQMSFAWYGEIIRAKIIDAVGAEHAAELEIHYPKNNPAGLEQYGEANLVLDDGRLQAFTGPFLQPMKGSNAWSVAGSKTVSGKPILCNDPHLPMMQPGIWYQNHLTGGSIEVTGVSIPGAPLVMIGHNAHIAWGATLAFTDIQDLFVEKFTDSSCANYVYKEEVRTSQIIEETIKVKGKPDHIERVVITHHGPVISDITGEKNLKLTLCSKALGQSNLMQGWYDLNRAANWNDFVGAMKHINAPALNVPYADVHGNIGYWVTGEVPVRKEGNGSVPSEGWTGANEWKSIVPFEEMPHTFNPSKGYVVTCNHKVVGDDYPHYLGNAWMNGYRARRLENILKSKDKFTIADMKAMQMDIECIPALEFIEHFKALNLDNQDINIIRAKHLMVSWDGKLSTDSVAASVYELTRLFMLDVVVGPKLGEDLTNSLRGNSFSENLSPQYEFYGYDTVTLLRLLDDPNSWWIEEAGGKSAVMLKSLEKTVEYLMKTFGEDTSQWHWGNIHQLSFHHIIGGKKPLDKIFNQGPFPVPGDTDTLLQTAPLAKSPLGDNIIAPSYRQIIDMGNFSNSVSIMPPGQSGNTQSQFYNDHLQKWLDGQYNPMLWEKEEIERKTKFRLKLTPQ